MPKNSKTYFKSGKAYFKGTVGDSFLLIFVKLITLALGIVTTRLLSEHFSKHAYGTYSQVMLIAAAVSSLTIMGMMDGINFFFCREKNEVKRNSYVSTIFFLQYLVSAAASIIVLACTVPLSKYFGNADLRQLVFFAALLPVLQNSISLLQIMYIAIGKTKAIAVRNLIVSVLKLIAITLACYVFDSIAFILFFQLLLDLLQTIYFAVSLRKSGYPIHIRFDRRLVKEILKYCIPMAMYVVIKSLNRDIDKFVISYFTDTETLAVYTNASKLLPFDILMASFCTVLLPYATRYIAEKRYEAIQKLYKAFLELSYVSTTVLAVGAICAAPELMRFLYTDKYLSGLTVFIIYIAVDIFSVLNLTFILSAAGKTKTILFASLGSAAANILFNVLFFKLWGIIGPALSTLLVTIIQGAVIFTLSAKEIRTSGLKLFDIKFLLIFIFELALSFFALLGLRKLLEAHNVHYVIRLILIAVLYIAPLLLINLHRLLKDLSIINRCRNVTDGENKQGENEQIE